MKTHKSTSLKTIAYFLISLILLQSCTIYQNQSTSLDNPEFYEKNKVHIITEEGVTLSYIGLEEQDDFYYGIIAYKPDKVRMKISKQDVDQIFVFTEVKICLKNGDLLAKYKGLAIMDDDLYGITRVKPEMEVVFIPDDNIGSIYLVNKKTSRILTISTFVVIGLIFTIYLVMKTATESAVSSINFGS